MAENPNPKPRYPIQTIIDKLGIKAPCYHYGDTIAKIPYTLSEQRPAKRGKLVLVTAITPTAAGEGKTTTVIGLGQAMNRLNKKSDRHVERTFLRSRVWLERRGDGRWPVAGLADGRNQPPFHR